MQPKDTGSAEQRRGARRRLVRTGTIEFGGRSIACFVVDLSKKGARIRLLRPLKYQVSSLNLRIHGMGVFAAEIRWISGKEIGLLLNDRIESFDDKENATIQEVLGIV